MNAQATVDSIIRTPVESNLLKYAAGQNIFCPSCGNIMDWRTTILASVHGIPQGKTEEICIRTFTACSKCFDKRRKILEDGVEKSKKKFPQANLRIEIVDGRDARFNEMEEM